jgi:hypothetical protein
LPFNPFGIGLLWLVFNPKLHLWLLPFNPFGIEQMNHVNVN